MSAISAAAVSASRRKPIGVAPACPATPSTPTSSLVAPLIAVDDPERQPLGLQRRSLLDMRFDEGGDARPPDRPRPFRIAAESLQRVAHREAGRVALVERILRICPGERPRAREGGAEANALLVAEGDDLDCVIEALAAPGQRLDHRERSQRAIDFRRSDRRRARCRYASPASAPARPRACPRSAPPHCRRRRSRPRARPRAHQPMKACAARRWGPTGRAASVAAARR